MSTVYDCFVLGAGPAGLTAKMKGSLSVKGFPSVRPVMRPSLKILKCMLSSELFEGFLDMDKGCIRTDDAMHTNIPGVFAAGDIRVKDLRQVVTAAADGAIIAAMQAEHYIENMK